MSCHHDQKTLTNLASGQGKTVLHITHQLEELRDADQILYLKEGEVVDRGSFQELAEKQGGLFAGQMRARSAGEDEVNGQQVNVSSDGNASGTGRPSARQLFGGCLTYRKM